MNEYTVDINGIPHTVLLSDADAKARGAARVKAAEPASNKAKTPQNKSA